jgi:hypothetical protein
MSEDNGTPPPDNTFISDAVEARMLEACRNSVGNLLRSLLDFIDLQQQNTLHADGSLKAPMDAAGLQLFFGSFRKRVFNDTPQLEYNFQAIVGMAKRGGEIPRFGRSAEDRLRKPHVYRG